MAPLTRDAVETAHSATDTTVSRTLAPASKAPASGGLRADAVSLEVAVRVYGSRITQVAGQAEPNSEPFEEQTSTMIVFPQGCVLRMSTTVTVGQMLVVTNAKSKQDAICRVVKVRTFSNTQGYVEVEFTTAQPSYWAVRFPSEGPAPVAAAPVAAAPSVAPANPPAPVKAAEPAKPAVAQAPPVVAKPATPAPVVSAPVVAAPVVAAPVAHAPAIPVTPVTPPPAAPVAAAPVVAAPVATPPVATPSAIASVPPTDEEELNEILNRLIAPTPASATPVAPVAATPAVGSTNVAAPAELNTKVPLSVALQSPLPAIEFPAAPPAAPEPSVSISDLRGDALPETASASTDISGISASASSDASVSEPAVEAPRRSFGSFSGGQSLTGGTLLSTQPLATSTETESSEHSDSSRDSSVGLGSDYAQAPKQSHMGLIAACVITLFLVVGAGVFYFRTSLSGGNTRAAQAPNSPASASASEAEPTGVTSEQTALRNSAAGSNAAQPSASSTAPAVSSSTQPNSAESNNAAVAARANALAKQAQAKALEGIVDATSNAHPVSSQRADSAAVGSAPTLETGGSEAASLSGIVAANDGSTLKAPEIRPEGPIRVGGDVKEPRLISNVMPTYPLTAKQAGIQGDVVVQTTIDARGYVTDMKVISGPIMLRQPALDALRRWRYAPSTLNGQPISLQMQVTIKFSRP